MFYPYIFRFHIAPDLDKFCFKFAFFAISIWLPTYFYF